MQNCKWRDLVRSRGFRIARDAWIQNCTIAQGMRPFLRRCGLSTATNVEIRRENQSKAVAAPRKLVQCMGNIPLLGVALVKLKIGWVLGMRNANKYFRNPNYQKEGNAKVATIA